MIHCFHLKLPDTRNKPFVIRTKLHGEIPLRNPWEIPAPPAMTATEFPQHPQAIVWSPFCHFQQRLGADLGLLTTKDDGRLGGLGGLGAWKKPQTTLEKIKVQDLLRNEKWYLSMDPNCPLPKRPDVKNWWLQIVAMIHLVGPLAPEPHPILEKINAKYPTFRNILHMCSQYQMTPKNSLLCAHRYFGNTVHINKHQIQKRQPRILTCQPCIILAECYSHL